MRADRTVIAALIVASVASVAFIVAYGLRAGSHAEGATLGAAAAALAVAAAALVRLLPHERATDEIDEYPSTTAERDATAHVVETDVRDVTRYRLLRRWGAAALALFGAALVVPIRSLGPAPGATLFGTKWRRGARLCREDGKPITAAELNVDSAVTVFPEGSIGDAQSQAVLIRVPPDVEPSAQGYMAYSRVCTHAGCPVALYRAAARQLMCPCHQSVFDVTKNGEVVSGPADHALPRLPIAIGPDGSLRATGDFPEPVGPGFWERA